MIKQAQAAAVILLLTGAALALAPISWGEASAGRPQRVPRTVAQSAGSGVERLLDESSLAAKLRAIAVPMPSEAAPVARPSQEAPAAEPAPAATVWEYIGGLIGPGARRAIVTLSGSQRMVSEGDVVEGSQVNAITADFIVLEEKGVEKRLDRKNHKERKSIASLGGKAGAGKGGMDAAAAIRARQGRASSAMGKPPKGKMVGNEAPPGKVQGAIREQELHDKMRQAYIDAMRQNNNQPLDAAILSKFGLEGFEPTPEEIEEMTNLIKEDPSGLLNNSH
jgi:hypothetical protein